MTWPRYLVLCRYWEKFPPVGALTASLIQPATSQPTDTQSSESGKTEQFGTMEELARDLAQIGGFQVNV